MTSFRLGEFHPFEGGGKSFVYLPSGAVYELDQLTSDVIGRLRSADSMSLILAFVAARPPYNERRVFFPSTCNLFLFLEGAR